MTVKDLFPEVKNKEQVNAEVEKIKATLKAFGRPEKTIVRRGKKD
jgi:nucleotide-binding universal stress UspA family protein